MATMVRERRSRLRRIPIVPWVRCAVPSCDHIIAQRRLPWDGDPIWIQCRHCGAMNRVDTFGVKIVDLAGDT